MIYRLCDFQFPDDVGRLYPDADRPWVLEVGFGDGRFWPHHAKTYEQVPNYLGVEISGTSLLKAHRRLREAQLENCILTKLPADVLVREVIPQASLDSIVVNFPDPWPKAGHEHHRLLRAPFFELAASRLKPGGNILFTTDHDEYFEFACAEAKASGVIKTEWLEPPAAALETKYALKWRDLGLSAHHACFTPTRQLDVPHGETTPYPEEESLVPHAILQLPAEFDPTVFEKYTNHTERHTVVLLDMYSSLRRDGWVALAHVVEGELTQEVLVGIHKREDGSYLVRLARFGGPIITPGVKAAVGTVTQWLRDQGGKVVHYGY